MSFRKIAVLTSKESWFVPYAKKLVNILNDKGCKAKLFFKHEEINKEFEIVFILSYFKIIGKEFLERHKHNLVVHESDLPKGRGWSPLFWQILDGKNKIPIVLFEANEKIDDGKIYMEDYILLEGHELHDKIREKQAEKSIELCLKFLKNYNNLKPIKQTGKATYYKRRTSKDSRLDINKSIKEQFNLLRTVNNKEFPAFFYYNGHKYIVSISKDKFIGNMGNVKRLMCVEALKKTFRIANMVFINFVDLSEAEKEMVRGWRNNIEIRKWMYTDHIISKKEHEEFIEHLKNDDRDLYWVVKYKKNEYLGVIYLTQIDFRNKHSYIGVYTNPNSKIHGKGTLVGKSLKKIAFQMLHLHTLKAELLEDNERAFNLYKKLGFEEEARLKEFVFKNNKWGKIIVMGLTNR